LVVSKSLSLVGEDRDTTIIDGNGKGIAIYVTCNVSQVLIRGFTLHNGQTGIKLGAYSNDNIIINNRIENNDSGIVLVDSSRNSIINNIIENNVFNGIHPVSSTDGGSNQIIGNDIIGNLNGVNSFCGVTISPNVFSDNDFISNTRQAIYHDDNGSDTWDGNYWSEHIGDTLYRINTRNIDQHPLTSPYEKDATPPEVTAAFVSIGDDKSLFKVHFSATDNCDPAPAVSAVIRACGKSIPVTNWQIIKIKDDDCEIKWADGRLKIVVPKVVLEVTAVDASGNRATATVVPPFPPDDN
jgi:parallel beta-helix repeat protein